MLLVSPCRQSKATACGQRVLGSGNATLAYRNQVEARAHSFTSYLFIFLIPGIHVPLIDEDEPAESNDITLQETGVAVYDSTSDYIG